MLVRWDLLAYEKCRLSGTSLHYSHTTILSMDMLNPICSLASFHTDKEMIERQRSQGNLLFCSIYPIFSAMTTHDGDSVTRKDMWRCWGNSTIYCITRYVKREKVTLRPKIKRGIQIRYQNHFKSLWKANQPRKSLCSWDKSNFRIIITYNCWQKHHHSALATQVPIWSTVYTAYFTWKILFKRTQ